MRKKTRFGVGALVLALLVALSAGCGDDSSADGGGSGGGGSDDGWFSDLGSAWPSGVDGSDEWATQ